MVGGLQATDALRARWSRAVDEFSAGDPGRSAWVGGRDVAVAVALVAHRGDLDLDETVAVRELPPSAYPSITCALAPSHRLSIAGSGARRLSWGRRRGRLVTWPTVSDPDLSSFLPELDRFLRARREELPEGSYTTRLLTEPTFVQRKIMEEAFEVCLELQADEVDPLRTAEEAADLVFHLMAALIGAGVSWAEVEAVLRDRHSRPARHSTYGEHSASAGSEGEGKS